MTILNCCSQARCKRSRSITHCGQAELCGVRLGKKLSGLCPWLRTPSQRRNQLLSLYSQLQKRVQELDQQVEEQAQQRPQALRLLTHPGVGPVTALATEVFLGDPSRFADGKAVASYIGMIPCEHSKRQRLGRLTKQRQHANNSEWRSGRELNSTGKLRNPRSKSAGGGARATPSQVVILLISPRPLKLCPSTRHEGTRPAQNKTAGLSASGCRRLSYFYLVLCLRAMSE